MTEKGIVRVDRSLDRAENKLALGKIAYKTIYHTLKSSKVKSYILELISVDIEKSKKEVKRLKYETPWETKMDHLWEVKGTASE